MTNTNFGQYRLTKMFFSMRTDKMSDFEKLKIDWKSRIFGAK